MGIHGVKIMGKDEITRKGFKFDDETMAKFEKVMGYLKKKYGIDTMTGSLKYLIRKGEELADKNEL